MDTKIIVLSAIILIAIGGVGAYNEGYLPQLDESNISNQSNDTNTSLNQSDDSGSDNPNLQNSSTNTSNTKWNMDDVANKPGEAEKYLDSEGKTMDTITTSDGKKVTLTNNPKPQSNNNDKYHAE